MITIVIFSKPIHITLTLTLPYLLPFTICKKSMHIIVVIVIIVIVIGIISHTIFIVRVRVWTAFLHILLIITQRRSGRKFQRLILILSFANISVEILKSLYFALVHPHLLYCISVYSCTSTSVLKRLTILQKKAIRITFYISMHLCNYWKC